MYHRPIANCLGAKSRLCCKGYFSCEMGEFILKPRYLGVMERDTTLKVKKTF